MATKKHKLLKAQKPTSLDKDRKAKRTGYRFKTKDVPTLHKNDGDLNAKGKKLYFKKPTQEEIEKYKKRPDGSYPDKTKEIYHERRADRKHSDDNLRNKYGKGGKIKQNAPQSGSYSRKADAEIKAKPAGYRYTDKLAKRLGKSVTAVPTNAHVEKYLGKGVYDEKRKDKSDVKPSQKLAKGGKIKQNAPQSESYTRKADAELKAKPAGKRYTDKLAKKLHKSPTAVPTKADTEQYLGNGVYDEKRKDKSDIKPSQKLEDGGTTKYQEMSVVEMKSKLGREPNYPYDFIEGKKWVKCFLRPFYKCEE